MFWKAAIGTETLGRSKDCCSCMRAVHSTDGHTLQTDTVRRGNSYPKNTDSEEGSINGFQQASAPATAPIQTKSGKPIAALQSTAWSGYHIKVSGAFSEIQSIFLLADQKKMDELAKLPLAGTWSQVSE